MYIEYKGNFIADITPCIIIHIEKILYFTIDCNTSGLFKWLQNHLYTNIQILCTHDVTETSFTIVSYNY